MIKHYLKTAWRNLVAQKTHSLINVLGLAIGLASALLICLFLFDELTYDTIHPEAEQTYRLGLSVTTEDGDQFSSGYVPSAWATQLAENYPEVLASTKLFWVGYPVSIVNEKDDKILLTEEFYWVDSNYQELIYLPLQEGQFESVFATPNSMAISESVARELFGTEQALGRQLIVRHPILGEEQLEVLVEGVFKDYPTNSHIRPQYLLNFHILEPIFGEQFHQQWDGFSMQSYIKVSLRADMDKLKAGMNGLLATHVEENAARYDPFFRKITDLHFDDTVQWVNEGAGDKDYLYIFGSIALLIILIASINYMNLATARSTRRAREIGLRKTVGSSRGQLIGQFFGEALLTSMLAMGLAMLLVAVCLPYFNQISGKAFTVASLVDPRIIAIVGGTLLVTSVLSGIYPALYLSGFRPVEVLKNRLTPGKGPEFFRRVLVVIQFAISVVLIICTGIILMQMNYLQSSKLNKAGEQMVSIRFGGTAPNSRYPVFKQMVSQDPELDNITLANHLPRQEYFGPINWNMRFPGVSETVYNWSLLNVDNNFPETFDLTLLAGNFFDETLIADSATRAPFLINEAGMQNLGLDVESVIGVTVNLEVQQRTLTGQVIGVVKDFPYRSMRTAIEPLLVTPWPHPIDRIIYVKLPQDQMAEKIAYLEQQWKKAVPGVGFDYWFVDEEFGRMYANEGRTSKLINVFSLLAILVACLGVYGLASYLADRKSKEIGIRKVLGASVQQISLLLSRTFVGILGISCLVGIPLSLYLMKDWLSNYVYQVAVPWWLFVGAVAGMFIVIALTVGYEIIRAAQVDPVKYLRDE